MVPGPADRTPQDLHGLRLSTVAKVRSPERSSRAGGVVAETRSARPGEERDTTPIDELCERLALEALDQDLFLGDPGRGRGVCSAAWSPPRA